MTLALVTGATGTVGSSVVRIVEDRGMHVRAFVRDPHRAALALGGDRRACATHPRQFEYEANAMDAAAASGVERTVKRSGGVRTAVTHTVPPPGRVRWCTRLRCLVRAEAEHMGIESSALWESFKGKATSDQQVFVCKLRDSAAMFGGPHEIVPRGNAALDCVAALNPAVRPRSTYLSTQDFVG